MERGLQDLDTHEIFEYVITLFPPQSTASAFCT